ncbi:hypothetical protein MHA01_29460 [Marinococcus halophilus]|uniref:Uncharacterized protein n=1 Tax=Marinococcus halophilus TaxID=1371 RepID=A0A510YBM8_MARHA|nr:hypothetical protein MHA01_29460 [Marinococcus halophilus]
MTAAANTICFFKVSPPNNFQSLRPVLRKLSDSCYEKENVKKVMKEIHLGGERKIR